MSCEDITDLANSIWMDIGQPTDQPVSYIQSKLLSNPYLGKLNLLTTNCHSGVSGCIWPPLDINENAIYELMYQVDFYQSKINNLMQGTDISFVTIQDGDSRITRVNTVDMCRLYRDMNKQLNDQLNNYAYAYRQASAQARTIDFYTINNSWNAPFTQTNYLYYNNPTF